MFLKHTLCNLSEWSAAAVIYSHGGIEHAVRSNRQLLMAVVAIIVSCVSAQH